MTSPRRFFSASRRSRAAAVGRVGTRRRSTRSASRNAATSRSTQAAQPAYEPNTGGAPARGGVVQNDAVSGNAIPVYDRSGDGTLQAAGTYPTGGLGGALSGSVIDHLASQGSLAYDRGRGLLYAVNAGSNTVADHLTVLTAALAQIPGSCHAKILIRVDGARATHELLKHLEKLNTKRSCGT